MKPIAAISLGAMLSLAAFGADAAQLRLNATVTDDAVRLGDLFDGLAKGEAERPVAPAPVLGRTNAFDADFLRRLATTYHVEWQPASKDTRILVTRAARTRCIAGSRCSTKQLAATRLWRTTHQQHRRAGGRHRRTAVCQVCGRYQVSRLFRLRFRVFRGQEHFIWVGMTWGPAMIAHGAPACELTCMPPTTPSARFTSDYEMELDQAAKDAAAAAVAKGTAAIAGGTNEVAVAQVRALLRPGGLPSRITHGAYDS